jgi:hypothetical protein
VAAGNAAAATSTVTMATSRKGFLMALLLHFLFNDHAPRDR